MAESKASIITPAKETNEKITIDVSCIDPLMPYMLVTVVIGHGHDHASTYGVPAIGHGDW